MKALWVTALVILFWAANAVMAASPSCTFGKTEKVYLGKGAIEKVLFCKKKSGASYVELVWTHPERTTAVVEPRKIISRKKVRNALNQRVNRIRLSTKEAFLGTSDVDQLIEIPSTKALQIPRSPGAAEELFLD